VEGESSATNKINEEKTVERNEECRIKKRKIGT
jgi:hypothetical protein